MKLTKLLFLILTLTISLTGKSQCNTNTSICTSGVAGPFNFINASTQVSTCLDFWNGVATPNYAYIILHITSSGPLNMLINANTSGGFLDVAVFNVPPGQSPCTAIQNTANQISCNYASSASGCNQFGTYFPCTASVPAPNVVAGQELMIVVEDWSAVQTNITLQLGPSPGAQTGAPNPTITPAGPFCTSSPAVQLIAADMGGVWSGPGTSSTGLFNPATAGVGTHTINYSVGVAPCNSASSTTITVNPAPIAGTASTPVSTFCGTSNIPLTLTGSSGTIQWQSGPTSTGPWTNITGGTAASFSANGIATNTCFKAVVSGCGTPVNSNVICVTINPPVTANANIDQSICGGSAITLAGSVSAGVTSWTWSAASGTFSNATSLTSTYTPTIASGTINITLTTNDPTGPCPAATDFLVLTVNPLVTVNANIDQTVCANGTATLAGSFGGGATAVTWSAPSGSFSNASLSTSTYTPTITTGSVTLTLTTNDPFGPCLAVTDQMVITVNPLPTVTVNSPVICAGASATITATPGVAGTNYSYAWTVPPGATAPGNVASFSTSIAGTYSIIITNTTTNCASASALGTVTVNPLPTATVNSPVVCAGTLATITATPGIAGSYNYVWTVPATATNPGNAASFTTTIAGTYSVVITNPTTNCVSASASGIVTVNPLPTVVANDVSVCTGNTITVTASGANTYSWSPATNLSATTGASVTFTAGSTTDYIVTGTSSAGCVNTDPVTVTVNNNVPISAGSDVSICIGGSTPLTATGGNTYTWTASTTLNTTVGASVIATPTTNTTYTVTGTDINGCVGADQVTVTVNPLPTVTVNNSVICTGAAATITATPGVAGTYSYAWTVPSGATAPGSVASFSTSVAGTYSVIITNTTTNCVSTSASGTITVNPIPTATVNSPTVCAGTNATVTASPGVAGSYSYAWAVPSGATAPGNVASFSTTIAGTYSVILTNPSTLCASVSASGTVTANPLPTATVNSPTVCAGTNATVTATPGVVGTYNYTWTVPSGATAPGNVASFSTTIAGTYSVILTDPLTNCASTSASGTVTVSPLPTVTVNSPTVCAGTNAIVTASPGVVGTYSYAWTVPATATNPGNVNSFTATVSGVYSVILTNTTSLCVSASSAGTVTINPLPSATVNSPTVCAGTNATVTATPGVVGTYSYAWTVPATATNPGNAVSFTATVSGTYSVILTNTSTSCVSALISGTVTINPLPIITLSPNDPTTCNGTDGFITVNGTGTGTLTWSGAAAGTVSSVTLPYSIPTLASGSYNVTFTNSTTACASSLVSTILNNPNAPVINAMPNLVTCGTPIQLMNSNITGTNLTSAVGYYSSPNGVGQIVDGTTYNSPTPVTTIYVYNANGICSAQISFTVTVNTIPTVTVNSTAVCAGINATVTATPGVAGTYSYAWTVPIGATAPGSVASFSTTVAGTYSVIITNTATNCASTSASGIVNVNPLPTVTVNSPIICAGASATITATPGLTDVYNYAWTVPSGVTAPGNVATFSTTIAGTYSVIITNSTTNCVSTSASGTVTVNPLPTATVNSPSICAGTPATVTASPGVAGTYSYAWTVPTTATNPGDVANFQTTVAGIYSVILTNTTTLCLSASASGTVTVNALPTATVNSPTVCAGTNATVTASPGATGTYNYAWTVPSGATVPGNVATFQTTIAGTYSVILTDPTTLCISAIASGIVTVNPLPTATVNSPTICADATATITATTGIAATYSYAWTVPSGVTAPGDVASFSTTIAGTYSVIITNTTTACFSTSASGIVTVNALPTATIAGNVTLCQGETQPTITFTGANATAPYIFTYTINGGINQTITSIGNTATLTNSTAIVGSYSYDLVSVQDASTIACSQLQSGTATITVNPSPTATISGNATVCVGEPDQIVTFNGAAGTAPYTFSYTENGVLQTLTSIGNSATIIIPANSAGVYNFNLLSVQDASQTACSQNQSGIVNVTINPIPTVAAGANLIICYGETVILNGAGATTYTWDNGVTNGVIFTPEIGTLSYTVTGTTAAGCTNSDVLDITVNSLPNPSFLPNVNLGCAPLEVTITNTTPNATNCVWTISDGSVFTNCGPITTTFEQSGCYDITLTTTDANNCTNSFIATNIICVEDSPNASFSPSGTSLSTQFTNVYFENNTTGANQYSWNFGDDADLTNEENPIHSFPEESGNYLVTLIATSPNGCIDSTSLNINIYEDLLFYVPNTFTPDFDNFNQVFQPIFTTGFDPYDFTLLIFNRWGEIVFESHDASVGWNGSFGNNGQIGNVQEGTYTWKIEFKAFDNDYRKVVLGSVNLLR